MSTLRLLALMLVLGVPAPVSAGGSAALQAAQHYQRGEYDAAIEDYLAALAERPDDPVLLRGLGRAYGRAAEQASWLRALDLAGRARDSFERAVHLAPDYADALIDLMKFYASAPGFLGGGVDKALALAERLDSIDPGAARRARDWLRARNLPAS